MHDFLFGFLSESSLFFRYCRTSGSRIASCRCSSCFYPLCYQPTLCAQIMKTLRHQNVVHLKHCFFSNNEKDELCVCVLICALRLLLTASHSYLNLVMEYVPETIYRVVKHYNKTKRPIPMLYIKLYMYQGMFYYGIHVMSLQLLSLPVLLSCSFPCVYSRDGCVPPRHQTAESAS
jgi:hypothetical protein